MTTTGGERRDTAAGSLALFALYVTLLFTVAALIDRDGVPAVSAVAFALVAASLLARDRFVSRHGRTATPANGLAPRRASGNTVVLATTLAVMDVSEPLLHQGRWTGDGPAFFLASVTTGAVATVVWLLLVRRDRRRAGARTS